MDPLPALSYLPPLPVTCHQPIREWWCDTRSFSPHRTPDDPYLISLTSIQWRVPTLLSQNGTCNGNQRLEAQPGFLDHKGSFHPNRYLARPIVLVFICPGSDIAHHCQQRRMKIHGVQNHGVNPNISVFCYSQYLQFLSVTMCPLFKNIIKY